MKLAELVEMQILKLKASASIRGRALEELLEDPELAYKPVQMCAKVSPELIAALENVVSTLDITKREFIESAVSEAVLAAENAIREMGREFAAAAEQKAGL